MSPDEFLVAMGTSIYGAKWVGRASGKMVNGKINNTTYHIRFLLENSVFLFNFYRPISTDIFCCTGTISISGNVELSQRTEVYRNHQSLQLVTVVCYLYL